MYLVSVDKFKRKE